MPFFSTFETIEDHAKYRTELKTALKSPIGKKFYYFKRHKLIPKRNHLLVIEPPKDVIKTLGKPTAMGRCELNDRKELVLSPEVGKMLVRPVRRYIETFYTERTIYIPKDEPEDIDLDENSPQTEQVVPKAPLVPQPLSSTSPGNLVSNTPPKA